MSASSLPLVVTADQDLLDDLLRLAAAGGTEVEVAADPAAARARLPTAPLLVLGADQVVAGLRARLPRHPRTLIVGCEPQALDEGIGLSATGAGAVSAAVDLIRKLVTSPHEATP